VDGTTAIVAETTSSAVAVSAADGKLLWQAPSKTRYNASSPVTDGDKVVYAGSSGGLTAVKLEKKDDKLKGTELWSTSDYSVEFSTPVVQGGRVYGLAGNNRLFCLEMKAGKKVWDHAVGAGAGGRGRGGYGTIVDAGSVLLALTPAGELLVFEANAAEYKQVAKYPVGSRTYAYPVVSGKRIFVKDSDSVTLWVVE
jgi:outer membrane protein assembly factor BamB